jgi:hypothetical protein
MRYKHLRRQLKLAQGRQVEAIADVEGRALVHPDGVSEIVVTEQSEGWFVAEAIEGWMPDPADLSVLEPMVVCGPLAESAEAAMFALAVEVTDRNKSVKRQLIGFLSEAIERVRNDQ